MRHWMHLTNLTPDFKRDEPGAKFFFLFKAFNRVSVLINVKFFSYYIRCWFLSEVVTKPLLKTYFTMLLQMDLTCVAVLYLSAICPVLAAVTWQQLIKSGYVKEISENAMLRYTIALGCVTWPNLNSWFQLKKPPDADSL